MYWVPGNWNQPLLPPLRWLLGVFLLVFLFQACAEPPVSPEEVVRQYAGLLNQGQLEAAKAWCTPAGQAFLVALGEVMTAAEAAPDATPIIIRQIKCTTTDAVAQCQTTEYDGFEDYHTDYQLRLTAQGWRIDQPIAKGETTTTEEIVAPDS